MYLKKRICGRTLVTGKRNVYLLMEEIGHGGFSTVYRAELTKNKLPVAIKILNTNNHQLVHKKVFPLNDLIRETRICQQLDHPHIVKLLDTGITDNEEPFAVFEYIYGPTLRKALVLKRYLPVMQTVMIMTQLLETLNYLHSKDIIHRDLKPQNILMSSHGYETNIKIIDFGTSIFINEQHEMINAINPYSTGVFGSPAYSAPEQLRGLVSDKRSDLYSWALIFIECLIGKAVIHGRSVKKMIRLQLRPSEIKLPKALSNHALGTLLTKVLSKDPVHRFKDAAEVLHLLNTIDFSTLSIKHPSVPVSHYPGDTILN